MYLWTKPGTVQDANVDQPLDGLPYDGKLTMVESGVLNRHVVEIVPMTPDKIDLEELNSRKFDTSTGFAGPADVAVPDLTLERGTSNGSHVSDKTHETL